MNLNKFYIAEISLQWCQGSPQALPPTPLPSPALSPKEGTRFSLPAHASSPLSILHLHCVNSLTFIVRRWAFRIMPGIKMFWSSQYPFLPGRAPGLSPRTSHSPATLIAGIPQPCYSDLWELDGMDAHKAATHPRLSSRNTCAHMSSSPRIFWSF